MTPADEIRHIIDDWTRSFCRRDLDALLARYEPDAIFYDCKPPFQTKGLSSWRGMWEACLPCFPERFSVEHRDLTVHATAEQALAHHLFFIRTEDPSHPAGQTWLRATVGFVKRDGEWRIVHEHCSLPFDPFTGQAAFTKDPDAQAQAFMAKYLGCG